MATDTGAARAAMERNLRILPWWWVVRWFWLGEAIWVIYLIEERGLTIGEVLVFEAVHAAIGVTAEVPTGMVADRYGRRASMVLASALLVVGFLVFGLGDTVPLLIGAYALFAVAGAFMSGADNAFLFDTLQRLGRGAEFARRMGRMNAIQTAAIALFTVGGAALVRWTSLATPIVLSGVLSAPAVALAFALTEPPREGPRTTFLASGSGAMRRVLRRRSMWLVILLMTTAGLAIGLMAVTIQPVVIGYGVPAWTLGIFVGSQMALSSVGAWSASGVGSRLGLRPTLGGMAVLGAFALFGGAGGLIWLFPLFILPSFTWNVMQPYVVDFLSRRTPPQERATVLSINALTWGIAAIPATLVMAAVVDRWSLDVGLIAAGVVLLTLVIASYTAWSVTGDTEIEPAAASEAT